MQQATRAGLRPSGTLALALCPPAGLPRASRRVASTTGVAVVSARRRRSGRRMAAAAEDGKTGESSGGQPQQPQQQQPPEDPTVASARALDALERLTADAGAAATAAAATTASAAAPASEPASQQQQPQQLPEGVVAFLAAVAAAFARVQGAFARLSTLLAALKLWIEQQLDRLPSWAAARRLERLRQAADAAPQDVAAQVALLRYLNERARTLGGKASSASTSAAAGASAGTTAATAAAAEEVVRRVESRAFARDAPSVVVEYVKALASTGRLDRYARAEEAAAALRKGEGQQQQQASGPFEAAAQLRLLADALPGPGEDHRSLVELLRELQVQASGGAEAVAAASSSPASSSTPSESLEPGSSLRRPLHVVVQAPGGALFPGGGGLSQRGGKNGSPAYLYAPSAAAMNAPSSAPATLLQALWRVFSTALLLVGFAAAWLAGNQAIRRASLASTLQQQAMQQQQQQQQQGGLGANSPFGGGGTNGLGSPSSSSAAAAAAAANAAANNANAGGGGGGGGPSTEPKEYRREELSEASAKTFRDVLGCDEAKAELEEVVEFLRDPTKFTRLGAKLPKGVLLTGPPGTGKTLLAKAVAGEAGVPFFFRAGSEFEELYVGVGSRRMRALFAAAKKKAPCIVFIDEIDAIGGNRKHWENHARKTLNQLLVEMDGFEGSEGVIVLAATNLPDTLDPALKRPGRFDRMVAVPLPDSRGREAVLAHYLSDKPVAADVDAALIARQTPGFSGADLANLVNEAALLAAKNGDETITAKGLEWSMDKVSMGLERKSAVRGREALRRTAYHEGGHALVATHTPGATRVHKATIVPRGHALGMVTQVGRDDEFSITRQQMRARVLVCLGGTVAEELVFGKDHVSSGATDDLRQATEMARHMIAQCGMSEAVGPVYIADDRGGGPGGGGGSGVSEATRQAVDAEVRRVLTEARESVRALLSERLPELHRVAGALLDRETLTADDIDAVVRGDQLPPLPPVPPPPPPRPPAGGGNGGGADGKKAPAIEQQAAG